MGQEETFLDLGQLNGEIQVKSISIERAASETTLSLLANESYLQIKQQNRNSNDSLLVWDVIIDLMGRRGNYSDTLDIASSEGLVLEKLIISYQILQPVQDVFKTYRNEYWPFRARENVFNLRTGFQGDTLVQKFNMYNFSGKALDLQAAIISDSIMIKFEPDLVPHHTFTEMTLMYATSARSPLGFEKMILPIYQDNDTLSFLPIQWSILPLSDHRNQMVMANRRDFDFGTLKQGELIHEITLLSNVSQEPAEISHIESNCDCLTYEVSSHMIPPGGNIQLKVKFDTSDRLGLEQKNIAVFLKNTKQTVVNFTFKANVKN
jgi:hypothetical protein